MVLLRWKLNMQTDKGTLLGKITAADPTITGGNGFLRLCKHGGHADQSKPHKHRGKVSLQPKQGSGRTEPGRCPKKLHAISSTASSQQNKCLPGDRWTLTPQPDTLPEVKQRTAVAWSAFLLLSGHKQDVWKEMSASDHRKPQQPRPGDGLLLQLLAWLSLQTGQKGSTC